MLMKFLKISKIFFVILVFLSLPAFIFWLRNIELRYIDLRNQPPGRLIRYECITDGYPGGACGGWGKTLYI